MLALISLEIHHWALGGRIAGGRLRAPRPRTAVVGVARDRLSAGAAVDRDRRSPARDRLARDRGRGGAPRDPYLGAAVEPAAVADLRGTRSDFRFAAGGLHVARGIRRALRARAPAPRVTASSRSPPRSPGSRSASFISASRRGTGSRASSSTRARALDRRVVRLFRGVARSTARRCCSLGIWRGKAALRSPASRSARWWR